MSEHPINQSASSFAYLRSIARYPTDPRCNACPSALTIAKVLAQDYHLSMIDNHPRDVDATSTRMSDGLTHLSIRLGLAYTIGFINKSIPQPWHTHVRTLGRIFWLDEHDHDGVIVSQFAIADYCSQALRILDDHHQWIWDNRFCDNELIFRAAKHMNSIDGHTRRKS